MNISLNTKKTQKKAAAPPIGFGLNSRKQSTNVFGGDDDDSSDDGDDNVGDSRKRMNQQIAKEQAALRKRAQAALASTEAGDIFDYDGAYDSFRPKEEEKPKQEEEKKSRYIGDLLETAKKRQRDREAVMERKIAKEQALEDAQEDFAGKEKFITKAYRRKLEERKQWEAEEEIRQQEEDAKDVTKQTTAGAAMASFYGNFAHNVAVGGTAAKKKDEEQKVLDSSKDKGNESDEDFRPKGGGGMGFLAGFERSEAEPAADGDKDETKETTIDEEKPMAKPLTARERREQKVAAARLRYLKRKGIAMEQ